MAVSRCHRPVSSSVTLAGMPTSSTSPPGAVTLSAWSMESDEPTQSTTWRKPPVSWLPTASEPDRRRTQRGSSSGSHTTSAPSSLARRFCSAYLAVTTMGLELVARAGAAEMAASVSRPSVPAPMITVSSPWYRSAAWAAQAVGSIITAASSDRSSGTSTSWLGCATMPVDQPPPVSAQKPVCTPGSRWPKAMRSHRLM